MKRVTTSYRTELEMSPVKRLAWGMFWGFCISAPIFFADYIRPIFNSLVWGA